MKPEQTIELSQVAGLTPAQVSIYQEQLQRFAELVRNEALKEAANACDERGKYWCKGSDSEREAGSCATVIRSLKS